VFDRFTKRASEVMCLAHQIAIDVGDAFLGIEHLLFGLAAESSGIATTVLQSFGISSQNIRDKITAKIHLHAPGSISSSRLPITPGVKKVLEIAFSESKKLGDNVIGTEHILLALLSESEGVAQQILEKLNLNSEAVRAKVLEFLGKEDSRKPENASSGGAEFVMPNLLPQELVGKVISYSYCLDDYVVAAEVIQRCSKSSSGLIIIYTLNGNYEIRVGENQLHLYRDEACVRTYRLISITKL